MAYVILFFSLFLMSPLALAEEVLPAGCKPLIIQTDLVQIALDKPSLVMLHNLSDAVDLWVTHPVTESDANVHLSSRLQAGNWSALLLDKKIFSLSCIESRPGHEQQVPCVGLLAACLLSVKPPQSGGTFWAAEDMTLSALIAHVGSNYGFVLPSSG